MLSAADQLRARFAPNDEVAFDYRNRRLEGTLARANPKRAVVLVEERAFSVPYERLVADEAVATARRRRIESIMRLTMELLGEHGLVDWCFRFDHSTRRAGCCIYRDRTISISFGLAHAGTDSDIRETILHEIAHALVGRRHNHDAVWKEKALQIGCSGERTHRMRLAPPRYHVTCGNRCWEQTAERRQRKLVCRTCGGKLVYSPYAAA